MEKRTNDKQGKEQKNVWHWKANQSKYGHLFFEKKQRSIALWISFKHVVSCFTFHREREHLLIFLYITLLDFSEDLISNGKREDLEAISFISVFRYIKGLVYKLTFLL